MDNKGFEKEESDSDNSVLPNAVSDSETDSSKNAKPRKVSKSDVNIYSGASFMEKNQRRTSFELDVFRNLDKIDIFPSTAEFIKEEGDQFKVTKNFEDLYYIIVQAKGGKVVDNFLRNLFIWTVDGDCIDVKDSFGLTLARITKNKDLSFTVQSANGQITEISCANKCVSCYWCFGRKEDMRWEFKNGHIDFDESYVRIFCPHSNKKLKCALIVSSLIIYRHLE